MAYQADRQSQTQQSSTSRAACDVGWDDGVSWVQGLGRGVAASKDVDRSLDGPLWWGTVECWRPISIAGRRSPCSAVDRDPSKTHFACPFDECERETCFCEMRWIVANTSLGSKCFCAFADYLTQFWYHTTICILTSDRLHLVCARGTRLGVEHSPLQWEEDFLAVFETGALVPRPFPSCVGLWRPGFFALFWPRGSKNPIRSPKDSDLGCGSVESKTRALPKFESNSQKTQTHYVHFSPTSSTVSMLR